ncbi:unnamed protein product [Closterium sp. NIES-54]
MQVPWEANTAAAAAAAPAAGLVAVVGSAATARAATVAAEEAATAEATIEMGSCSSRIAIRHAPPLDPGYTGQVVSPSSSDGRRIGKSSNKGTGETVSPSNFDGRRMGRSSSRRNGVAGGREVLGGGETSSRRAKDGRKEGRKEWEKREGRRDGKGRDRRGDGKRGKVVGMEEEKRGERKEEGAI